MAPAGRDRAASPTTVDRVADPVATVDLQTAAALAAGLCGAPAAFALLLRPSTWGVSGDCGPWLEANEAALRSAVTTCVPGFPDILDLSHDRRFSCGDLSTGGSPIRFCALVVVTTAEGPAVGALGVFTVAKRCPTAEQQRLLMLHAEQLAAQWEQDRHLRAVSGQLRQAESAHRALRQREQLLDGVLAQADVLVYAKDLQERFLYANAALEAAVDVVGGLVGRANHEVFPADWAEEYRVNDAAIAASGSREVFEEEFLDPRGSLRRFRSTKYPLYDSDGRVCAIAGVSTDITELSAARAAHAEAEQRWRSLVEHSSAAVGLIVADGRITYLNPAGLRLCGARAGQRVRGRMASHFVPAEARTSAAALFRAVLAGRTPRTVPRWPLRRLDGTDVVVELSAAPVTHRGALAVQVELRDVSARVASEDALRASEQRLRAIFQHSPVAMALADEEGRWVNVNAVFCELCGQDEKDLVGAPASEFTHPDDRNAGNGTLRGRSLAVDGIRHFETGYERPGGERRWAWVSVTVIPGPRQQSWTLAVVQDITSRRAAEDALRSSEAELAAIARVAHCVQSGSDPRPVITSSLRTLSDAATVSLIEALDADTLVITAAEVAGMVGASLSRHDVSVTAQVWRTGEAVFIPDVTRSAAVHPLINKLEGTVSAMWQPVIIGGTVQAVLLVTWTRHIDRYRDTAAGAVRILADEAATSLEATRLRNELERSAMTDPLTGALNRRAWDLRLRDCTADARAGRQPLTVALVDLDRFKAFNDTHGHSAGDALLRDFAAAARTCLRRDDIFARWGGEEFSIALPSVDPAAAHAILDRVRACVPGGQSCSIGYTTWDPTETLGACIGRADAALYEAKRNGRNQLRHRRPPSPG